MPWEVINREFDFFARENSYPQTVVNEQWSEDGYFSSLQRPHDWTNKSNDLSEEDHVLKDTEALLMSLKFDNGHTEWSIAIVGHIMKCLYSKEQWRNFEILRQERSGLPFDIIISWTWEE